MKITPLGAAREVTGSLFHLQIAGRQYLVDCGLFQGEDGIEVRNETFPFSPKEISAVFITHAHLDHCGRIPLLFKQGFRGKIYCTFPTRDLAQFILLDAAKVQEEDYLRQARKKRRASEEAPPPLYSETDVLYAMNLFQPIDYGAPIQLSTNCLLRFHQSGHVLGSAFLEFEEEGKRILFSGDLGSPQRNVVPDPESPPPADLVFAESTYGDREHKSLNDSIQELQEAVQETYKAGGNVVIPAFALERAQDVLFYLRELRAENKVPQNQVFLDSPLSINLTEVYRHHIKDLDEEIGKLLQHGEEPFSFPGLEYTRAVEQSRAINEKSRIIVIAGSGMCQGGRILHHLKHNLWREESGIIFVGYQARLTLGRALIDGAKKVHIYGEPIAVRARIYTINGFSAHADQAALLSWLEATRKARILLNHGEEKVAEEFAQLLRKSGMQAELAEPGASYEM